MSESKELIKEIDRRIEIETATLDGCPIREQSEKWLAMLKAIRGIVISYPIILKALKEANENIDNFIKSKPLEEKP